MAPAMSANMPMARRSAIAQSRGRSSVRVSASARRPESLRVQQAGVGSRLENLLQNEGLASVEDLVCERADVDSSDAVEGLGIRSRTAAKGIVDYMEKRTSNKSAGSSSNGAATTPHDAIVLSVLQNYSGLTQERLFNMLRNSGRFNENQSTLSFILNTLVSQGKVQNESGTYRFVSGIRSPSPAPSSRAASPAPRRATPIAATNGASMGAGDGASAGDQAIVLSVLQNYSGLTADRLSGMLRSSNKSVKGSVSSILSGLVSSGKVQNDNGTYRYVTKGTSPTPARTTSPTARTSSPARPGSSRPATPTAGDGASAGDQATVLAVLQNYSGLTADRLTGMLRNSKKTVGASVSSILSGLVSSGKVQNDNGTYRYVTKGTSPTPARTTSPAARTSSPARPASSRPATPTAGDGASAGDQATVLAVLQNYSGLTADRLSGMLRNSKKSVGASVSSILSGLVSSGKVQNDNGTYRYVTKGTSPTPARTSSPTPLRSSPTSASRPATPTSGDGASPGDQATVLAVLQNYSGLTADRLSGMLRNSKKSVGASVSSILSGLVSSGKVQNDNGTYRYVTKGSSPTPARTTSPAARTSSPARPGSSRPATPTAGDGANAGDQATVLAVLQNYSGLTADRLTGMLRNSKKSVGASVSSILSGLVSSGKVQNDNGTYRYVTKGTSPTPARTISPTPARTSSPVRAAASRSATPTAGDGASASDEAVVLSVLKNYSGLTTERLSGMLKNSGKSVGSLSSILDGLVRKGRVTSERSTGIFRFEK